MNHTSRRLRYFCFAIPGVTVGITGMVLGALLATSDYGWEKALFYSAIGLIGAPLATLAWGTNNPWRGRSFSGLSLLAGALGTMAILLEVTVQHVVIAATAARAPFTFASWLAIWILWISLALAKLILFEPEYRRRHSLPQ